MQRKSLCKVNHQITRKFNVLRRFTLHNLQKWYNIQELNISNIILEERNMQKQPLTELLQRIRARIGSSGFTPRGPWSFIEDGGGCYFSSHRRKGEIYFSERLGIEFVETHFHILEKILNGPFCRERHKNFELSGWLGISNCNHTVLRRYYKTLRNSE